MGRGILGRVGRGTEIVVREIVTGKFVRGRKKAAIGGVGMNNEVVNESNTTTGGVNFVIVIESTFTGLGSPRVV